MSKPIEVFASQEELDECLAWWQHRLFLDSWEIRAEVVDRIEDENGEEMEDCDGLNQLAFTVSKSYIQLLSADSYDQIKPMCGHICQEKTLVHELLHCIYDWLDCGESYEAVYLVAKEHQQVENMAKSLIMARYDLDYDYFHRKPHGSQETATTRAYEN